MLSCKKESLKKRLLFCFYFSTGFLQDVSCIPVYLDVYLCMSENTKIPLRIKDFLETQEFFRLAEKERYLIDMIRQLDDRKLRLVYTFVLHLLK